jgi:hypothetical protein
LRLPDGQTVDLSPGEAAGLVDRLIRNSSYLGSVALGSNLSRALREPGVLELSLSPLETAGLQRARRALEEPPSPFTQHG